jgi:hypothetical protein
MCVFVPVHHNTEVQNKPSRDCSKTKERKHADKRLHWISKNGPSSPVPLNRNSILKHFVHELLSRG